MGYRRGFKTEANNLSQEVRDELGLGLFDRLDPNVLADWLGIPVLSLTELSGDSPAILWLVEREPEAFSAVTVFRGSRRLVVHNDGHALPRQNSNIAHELSHALLHHPPAPALDDKGCRYWNQDIEDEATWLSAALLVTEAMTISIARGQISKVDAAWQLGVSLSMIQFRMNSTGAHGRVARARANRQAYRV